MIKIGWKHLIITSTLISMLIITTGCKYKVKVSVSKSEDKVIDKSINKSEGQLAHNDYKVEDKKKQIEELSKEIIKLEDKEAIYKALDDFRNKNENMMNVYFAFEKGNLIISPHMELPEGFKPQSRPWYIKAKEVDYYVSEVYTDGVTDTSIISVAKALYKDNKFVGVVGIDYNLSK